MSEDVRQIEPVRAEEVGGEFGPNLAAYAIDFLTTLNARPWLNWHTHLVHRLKRYGENPVRVHLGLEPVNIPSGSWKLGTLQRRVRTDEEIAYVLAETQTIHEAAGILEMHVTSLHRRLNPSIMERYRRNSGSPARDSGECTRHEWDPLEDELVIEHKMRDRVLATIIGVSIMAVQARRHELKKRALAAQEKQGVVAAAA